jgi:two-component system sensor histidine kinase CiaH
MGNLIVERNMNSTIRPDREDRPGDNVIAFPRSPRIIPILRDKEGKVINFGSVNNSYYEQYLRYLVFDKENLNTIIPIKIMNQYNFRSITTQVKENNGEEFYMQLVINSDSENALLQHISIILSVCIVIFIILSILASYILSQKTMKPIKKSWSKQVEFVENVSHELRTPLTIIQNSLEQLLTTPHGKIIDRSESIALALNETTRLSKLVTDMLTLARSDSTMTEINKDLFSLDILVKAVCQPYSELAESQNKSFKVSLQCPTNINADKDRIHQLLVILLDNALKYTNENDSISVATSFKDNKVCITVSDTGIGIGDESMERIFDRFFREDKARSRERGGMGLGLSIASWIVDKHGGTIKVKRNEPKGTTFAIRLPK